MHRLTPTLITLALSSAVFAGCIGDSTDDIQLPVQPELEKIVDLVHDLEDGHTMAAYHNKWSDNMRLVGFNSLALDDGTYIDGNAEVTYHDGYAYVATLGKDAGFAIVDVSDPENPQVVGRYSNPNVYSPDVKVSWDGRYAILSSHPGTTLATHLPPEANVLPTRLPDPTAYLEEQHRTGVTLVNIEDKANPRMVAFYLSEPDGTHNTEYAELDGREVIFSVDRNKVQVLEITSAPGGTQLVPIATITADDKYREDLPDNAASGSVGALLPPGSHDVTYQQHPLTGDHLIYIAFGRAGFYIYNVNDPTSPSLVNNWRGLPADSSYYHYARPVDIMVDERHVTIVAPELFNSQESTGTVAILDTSDPRDIKELGTWMLPGEDLFVEKNYRFSPHNFDIVDGKMYMANYHAGVWVVDLTCRDCLETPMNDGFYMPHAETDRIADGEVVCSFWCERPFVWGSVVGDDGLIYASDVESGLYIIEYTPDFWTLPNGA